MSTGTASDRDGDANLSQGTELVQLEFNGNQSLHQSKEDSESYTPPNLQEWKTMKGYGSFITRDGDGVEHTFNIHDMIYVLPIGMNPDDDLEPNDLWIAEIRSIRAHNDESVWIKAKWFYHPNELPKNAKGATWKLRRFGTLERISSNQADFIPTSSCCGIAPIIAFNEQDMEQEDIEDGIFFYRYNYDWQKRTLKNPCPPCSICKKAYNPDVDIMHFCPRPRCCRSWHATCLATANWFITSSIDLPQRMESLNGVWAPSGQGNEEQGPSKKARIKSPLVTPSPQDRYANIPQNLLAIARQPIVRGGVLGVVGNVRSVVRARKMLQGIFSGLMDTPEDWEQELGKVYEVDAIASPEQNGKAKGKGKRVRALAYQCPNCGEPI